MKKVITYGTFDMLHVGHVRLLERAHALGDYLIVGITAPDYDELRGKINVQQSLMDRIEGVRNTGLADEIIIEEYEGQKINDIKKYNIDVFTVGSDWIGQFDYLKDYCDVVYLDRTEGVSSTYIRSQEYVRLGIVGESEYLKKIIHEAEYVNGLSVTGMLTSFPDRFKSYENFFKITDSFDQLMDLCDAVYIHSFPKAHYEFVRDALLCKKHVLCESPIALNGSDAEKLYDIADEKNLVLSNALRTAYSTAYDRLVLLVKTGCIGEVVSVDATCTSLKNYYDLTENELVNSWNSITSWGPTVLLPVFQILGTNPVKYDIITRTYGSDCWYDVYTQINLIYASSVGCVRVGNGVKSEGELIISGTKGYIYVPAPWWKTDYFEIRFEDSNNNRRYFYPLEGEGIRNQFLEFIKSIRNGRMDTMITREESVMITNVMDRFLKGDYINI